MKEFIITEYQALDILRALYKVEYEIAAGPINIITNQLRVYEVPEVKNENP